jgi:predicted transcriptional regulator
MTAKTKDITVVEDYYPRMKSDIGIVERYRTNIDGLPPIIVTKDMIVVDGVHRLFAHRQEGRDEIEIEVIDIPESEILIEAIRLNSRHGEQLSSEEKRHNAVLLYRERGMDVTRIAEVLSVSERWVRELLRPIRRDEKKQTIEEVRDLRREKPEMTLVEIASETGVPQQTVSRWLSEEAVITQKGTTSEMGKEDTRTLKERYTDKSMPYDPQRHYEWCKEVLGWQKKDFKDFINTVRGQIVKGPYVDALMWMTVEFTTAYVDLYEATHQEAIPE